MQRRRAAAGKCSILFWTIERWPAVQAAAAVPRTADIISIAASLRRLVCSDRAESAIAEVKKLSRQETLDMLRALVAGVLLRSQGAHCN